MYLGHHDPKARKGGSCDGKPTKQRKYKYASKEEALAERNRRRNRARKEQRRRVHQRLMAAAIEETSKWQKRGGQKKWKMAMKRRYNSALRREKQRRKRRQEANHRIWQQLRAIVLHAEETATSLAQLANEEKDKILQKATVDQHWVAVGYQDQKEEVASVGRKVSDGILFRVAVSVAGRLCVALIDSGASQSYMAPETVNLCELECHSALVHLELADGTKIKSTQETQMTNCTVGTATCKINFTITKLLSNVDIVLGMDWLAQWNPVIDWRRHVMHIWNNNHWECIKGILLDSTQQAGSVKRLEDYLGSDHSQSSDWVIMKPPNVWRYNTDHKEEQNQAKKDYTANACKEQELVRDQLALRTDCTISSNKKSNIVSYRGKTGCEAKRQLISSKRVQKLLKRGETVYLAMVRSTTGQKQGVTQKVKQQMMKATGPIRKAPPIAETRQKMCNEAPVTIRKELQGLLEQYSDLFPEQLPKGRPPKRTIEFEIKTEEGAVPPNKPPYRLSPKEYEELQAQIDDLLSQGHIRPSTSPYGAPVLFVPKKDGRWRMCIDYRALNRQTIRDRYPLPRIDDLLDRLGQARHFTTLDLASGYHQIAVKESDIPKTAFRTQRGQFEFVVMPFGVTNAPATFQRMMNEIFKDELDSFVLVYLDDILIFSKTLEDHIQHIRRALEKLREAKLYARLHKCAFFQKRVEYLGFDVSQQGIQPSLEKVRTVVEWPSPKSVKDVRSFLGLAGFYRRFIKNFSLKARPLTDLTRDNVPWTWNEREEKAFCELKRSLVVAPVLHMPDFDLTFVVTTDASLVSVGAILEQDFGQGLQPIAFESRKLNPTETRYSAYERELLGIVWAIGKWRHYVEGRHFIVQTDHSSLRHLPNQPSVNRRIWKWVSILQSYDIEIRHIPGKVNPADALTRQIKGDDAEYAGQVKQEDADWVDQVRVPSEADDKMIQRRLNELYSTKELQQKQETIKQQLTPMYEKEQCAVLAVSESSIQIVDEMRQRIREAQRNDDQYMQMMNELQDPSQRNEVRINDKVFRMKRCILTVHEQNQPEQFSYWRTVVPEDQQIKLELLKELHCVPYAGHPGFTRTLEITRRHFYWNHMVQEVRQFVLDCPVCQVEKGSHLKPAGKLLPLDVPVRKWDHVVIDFVVGMPVQDEFDTICTVVDKATKMCHFIPCTEKISAKQVARLYWQHVGKLHGIPSVIISDRDPRFTGKFWRELWRLLGTDLRMGSGFHPESSGQVERFNQLLEQTLRCTVHQLGETRRWVDVLPIIEFAVNNTPNRTTGYSSFYLNYGYHPLHPLQLLHSPQDTNIEAVTQFTSRMQQDFSVALQQLNRARTQMMHQTDPQRRAVEFHEGDEVLLSTRHIRFRQCPTKLQRRYVGPFKVIQRINPAAYRLQLPEGWSMHPVFHVSLLKPWRESHWSCPVEEPNLDVDVEPEPVYEVERIWKWRKVKVGRKNTREFLVTWYGYPLEEAQWIPEANFRYPAQLRQQLKDDRPREDKGEISQA